MARRGKESGFQPPRHGGSEEASALFHADGPKSGILDFSISINPLGPPPGLKEVLVRALETVGGYPEIDARTLTRELAAFHALTPDHFIAGNGSTDLLFSLIPLLPNREAVIPFPTFIEYERACQLYGWRISHVPPRDPETFTIDTEAILSRLSPLTTLFLCQPNNPTGICVDPEKLDQILEKAEKTGAYVILDEAFLPFTDRPSAIPWVARHGSLVVLRSMTKSYGIPGLRLGYAVAAPHIISRWKRYLPPWNVNTLAQAAGVYCLRHGEGHLRESARFIREESRWLMDEIGRLPGLHPHPTESNFFLVSLETDTLSADTLYLSLGERKVLVRHCGSFRGMGDRHIRIGIKKREANQRLLSALRAVLRHPEDAAVDKRREAAGI